MLTKSPASNGQAPLRISITFTNAQHKSQLWHPEAKQQTKEVLPKERARERQTQKTKGERSKAHNRSTFDISWSVLSISIEAAA